MVAEPFGFLISKRGLTDHELVQVQNLLFSARCQQLGSHQRPVPGCGGSAGPRVPPPAALRKAGPRTLWGCQRAEPQAGGSRLGAEGDSAQKGRRAQPCPRRKWEVGAEGPGQP